MALPSINLISPINTLGYGYTGLNILCELSKIRSVALWTLGPVTALTQYQQLISDAIRHTESFDYHAPTLRIWHQFDMAHSAGYGPRCGLPIFELNRLTPVEKHHLNSLDKVFVPSQWALQVLKDNSIIAEVYVTPLGVDRGTFNEYIQVDPNNEMAKDTSTKFLAIGKWEYRKGHDIIIDAFNKAFTKDDKVVLVVNCNNPFLGAEGNMQWINLYKSSTLGEKIHIFPDRLETQQQVANLMMSVDCGILPARAEGFNLELLELMSCGKSVITTNYSAHTEFCTKENAFLIDISDLEDAVEPPYFTGQGQWAALGTPQLDQLIDYMRSIHKIKQEKGNIPQNTTGIQTAKRFSWKNTVSQTLKGIDA